MLKNRIVVITGSSGGIGAETARQFAKQGAIPILTARSADKLKETALSIPGQHGIYQLDVTSSVDVQNVFTQIVKDYGKIDVLINNAGFGQFQSFIDASLESFEEMMDVNYMGMIRCSKAVLPDMIARKSGHIVNIASMAGKIATVKSSGYAATKHAVLGMTNSLRQELRETGVRVSAINPGPVETPFFDRADPSGVYVDKVRWFMLKPEQVAKAIVTAVQNNKAETDLPRIAGFSTKMYQLFPRLLDRIASKMLNNK